MHRSRFVRVVLPWALLVGATLWAMTLVAAPYLAARGTRVEHVGFEFRPYILRAVTLVYVLGGAVCHQRPERSFHVGAVQFPVCARCFGLYAAAPLGLVLGRVGAAWTRGSFGPRGLLLLSAVPTAATLVGEWSGLVPMASWTRAVASAPLALVAGWVVAAALRGQLR